MAPSETTCLANSPRRISMIAIYISHNVMVGFLLYGPGEKTPNQASWISLVLGLLLCSIFGSCSRSLFWLLLYIWLLLRRLLFAAFGLGAFLCLRLVPLTIMNKQRRIWEDGCKWDRSFEIITLKTTSNSFEKKTSIQEGLSPSSTVGSTFLHIVFFLFSKTLSAQHIKYGWVCQ